MMAPSWSEKYVFNFAAQASGVRFCFSVSCIMVKGLCFKSWILLHCGSLVNKKNNLDGNGKSERVNLRTENGLRHEKK
jgi:hypothetical protein